MDSLTTDNNINVDTVFHEMIDNDVLSMECQMLLINLCCTEIDTKYGTFGNILSLIWNGVKKMDNKIDIFTRWSTEIVATSNIDNIISIMVASIEK